MVPIIVPVDCLRQRSHLVPEHGTVNSLYCGHCRAPELWSLLAKVHNISVKHLQFVLAGDLATVRVIGVSVITRCPQGES